MSRRDVRSVLSAVLCAVLCALLAVLVMSLPGAGPAAPAAAAAVPSERLDAHTALVAVGTGLPRNAAADPPTAPVVLRYVAPVPINVVLGFRPPPTPYAAGHRGVDLATTDGQLVLAAGAGEVSFAGSVAGRGVVVIVHPDGVSTEYEPVIPLVRAGQAVAAGTPIGRVHGAHRDCAPGGCLHWGAQRAGVYFDPLSLLTALGPVRLLPWAG